MPPSSRDLRACRFNLFNALLTGLAVAQIVATVQVYLSNLQLWRDVSTLQRAGYLPIPTLSSLEALNPIGSAVFGGLFFTLSTGAGLALVTIAAVWLWGILWRRNRIGLILLLVIWAAGLAMVNANGFSLFGSLYFALVPAAVAIVYHRCRPETPGRTGLLNHLLPLYPLAFLAIIWGLQADSRLFVNVRDFLLLSNPLGKSINDFYYRYTLHAAEAFKSLDQKLQRPVRLTDIRSTAHERRIESQLRLRDYLVVDDGDPVELQIKQAEGQLDWLSNGRRILSIAPEALLSNPDTVLAQVSRQTDRSAFLRMFTFLGILFAFPILLYSGIYGLLRLLAGLYVTPYRAILVSGILCFLVGTILLLPVYLGSRRPVEAANLAAALEAADWRDRLAALKLIDQRQLEITGYPSYKKSMTSRHLPERYWLAHALGWSHENRAIDDLITLLNDAEPNVVCQALYALGRQRGDRRFDIIEVILEKIRSTDNWYIQRYAYLALRSLGWHQSASN